jgi:hypothetical protein
MRCLALLLTSVFVSPVRNPVHVERDEAYLVTNLRQPATTNGIELLNTFRHAPFAATATVTLRFA